MYKCFRHTLSFVAQDIEEIYWRSFIKILNFIFHQEKFQVKLLYIVVLLFCCECMVMKNTMTTGVQDSGLSGDSRAAVA
jgi:hypothetical protein